LCSSLSPSMPMQGQMSCLSPVRGLPNTPVAPFPVSFFRVLHIPCGFYHPLTFPLFDRCSVIVCFCGLRVLSFLPLWTLRPFASLASSFSSVDSLEAMVLLHLPPVLLPLIDHLGIGFFCPDSLFFFLFAATSCEW